MASSSENKTLQSSDKEKVYIVCRLLSSSYFISEFFFRVLYIYILLL